MTARALGGGLRVEVLRLSVLALGLAIALYVPVSVGSHSVSALRLLAVLVVAGLSVLSGYVLSRWMRLPANDNLTVFVIAVGGFSLASLLHLAVVSLLHVGTSVGLLADFACITLLGVLTLRRGRAHSSSTERPSGITWHFYADVGLLLLASLLVTLWCREALGAVREAQHTGVLRVWNDFLLQATEIQYIQNIGAFGGQSPYLADTAQPFYHRASYALAAVFNAITRDGSLETSTYFWLPAGMILLGAAACGLGMALGGRLAALVALLALFLLPDASMYGLHNGYFAFHWLIQVAPGAGYALALALLALALYARSLQTGRFALVAWGFGMALGSTIFRAHVALPAIALLGLLTFFAWQPSRGWHRVAAALLLLAGGVGIVFGSEQIALAPHLISGQRDVLRYIEAVHLAVPIAYEGWWNATLATATDSQKAWIGYPMLMLAELGALLLALPLLSLARMLRGQFRWRIDCIPYVLLIVHSLIVFLLPTPANGDITEWSHRSFVLVYAVIIVLEAIWVLGLLQSMQIARRHAQGAGVLVMLLGGLGLMTPWHFGKNAQYGSLRDGPTACRTPISADLFAATGFIRQHAGPADRLQSSDSDPIALDVALTDRQAYVSRLPLYEKLGGNLKQLAAARAAENAALANIGSYEELRGFGRKAGVRWYLLRESDMPAWPVSLRGRSVFASGTIRIFDLQRP